METKDSMHKAEAARNEGVLASLGRHELPKKIAVRGVLIAAHPDDEVIGAGARLSRWSQIQVIHVTDGAPCDMRDATALGFVRREDYAALRRAERRAALDVAGVPSHRTHDLGYVDNATSDNLIALAADVYSLLHAAQPDVVVTHPYEGGHPDHDATAFAVHAAVDLTRERKERAPIIMEMTSYHLGPSGISTGSFLPNDHDVAFHTVLDEDARALKSRMLECHASQRKVLCHFGSEREPIRIAPRYDFGAPPHAGRLFYEHFDWWISGAEWRARARDAMRALGLRHRSELPP